MTTPHEEIVVDTEGIPILTDLVHEGDSPESFDEDSTELSTEEIAGILLNSDTFRQQLDELATELTQNIRQQVEESLQPAIEGMVRQVLDENGNRSYETVRHKLESVLPELLARSLHINHD